MHTHRRMTLTCLVSVVTLAVAATPAFAAEAVPAGPSPVWVTLMPKTPIRSLAEYEHAWRAWALREGNLDIRLVELEVRSARDMKRVAVVRDAITLHRELGNRRRFSGGTSGRGGLSRNQRRAIGRLPDGEYLVAVNVNGKRCSNVATLKVDAKFDPKKEPTLRLVPLPLGPGRTRPYVGLVATGPDPANEKFTFSAVSFPDLVVDGVPTKRTLFVWCGPDRPLKPGERWMILLDLDPYRPEIAGNVPHAIIARVLDYESALVTVPADEVLDAAWDKATARLKPLQPPTVSLRGTVTGWDGKPGVRYTVSLSAGNGRQHYGATCDAQGRYAFIKVPPGEYRLFTTRPGYGRGLTVKKVRITAGAITTLDLSVESKFRFSGTVRYTDGTPAVGRDVEASWRSPDGNMEFDDTATADAEGRYTIGSPFRVATFAYVMPGLDRKKNVKAGREDVDFVIKRR